MVARSGNESQFAAVRRPLYVRPFAAAAGHIVAQRGPVLVRGRLQPHHVRVVHVDDHAFDHGHVLVPRQRIFPGAQIGVSVARIDQVHLSGLALVLLKRGQLFRIRRPQHDGPLTAGPSGVVRGIAEIFDCVLGKLRLLAGGNLAHPKVEVADEGGLLAIRRERLGTAARPSAAPAASARRTPAARRCRVAHGGALGPGHIAAEALAGGVELHLARCREVDFRERQPPGFVFGSRRLGERRRKFRMVERRLARSTNRVRQDEFAALRRGDAIPEPVVRQPVRSHAGPVNQRRGVVAHELLGAGVVRRRQRTLLPQAGKRHQEKTARSRYSSHSPHGHTLHGSRQVRPIRVTNPRVTKRLHRPPSATGSGSPGWCFWRKPPLIFG